MIDIHPSVSTQNMQHRPVLKISACKLFNIQHRSQICDVAQRLKLKSKVSQRQNQNQNVNTNSCRLRLMSGTALSRTHLHVSEGQLFQGPTNGRESLLCHLDNLWTKTRHPESEYSGAPTMISAAAALLWKGPSVFYDGTRGNTDEEKLFLQWEQICKARCLLWQISLSPSRLLWDKSIVNFFSIEERLN